MIIVVNEWDRPGRDALELRDEIQERIGLRPTALTWPVGVSGDFRGVLDRRSGRYVRYRRTAGGATRAPEEGLDAGTALESDGDVRHAAVEEHELLAADGADHDQDSFLTGQTTPVLFASAISNVGVAQLLRTLVELAPAPGPAEGPRRCRASRRRAVQRVRLQGAGRDGRRAPGPPRLCPGLLRGLLPGDGCHPRPDRPVAFPAITSFAPEHFRVARAGCRRAHAVRGRRAAHGDRVQGTRPHGPAPLLRRDGELLALFPDEWRVKSVRREHPDVLLQPLVAGTE